MQVGSRRKAGSSLDRGDERREENLMGGKGSVSLSVSFSLSHTQRHTHTYVHVNTHSP